jgi:hypothetical protein
MAKRAEVMQMLEEAMQNGQVNRANFFRQKLGMEPINTEGASFGDRAAVSAANGPGSAIATLQNRHPGAQILPFGQDNFIMPGSDGPTTFNPPGFDTGDLGVAPRMGAEALGALTGGAVGLPGGIPGAMAGAGLGGAMAGQAYDILMTQFAGSEDTRGVGQMVGDTALDIGFNSMGGPTSRVPVFNGSGSVDDILFDRARSEMRMPGLTPAQTGSRVGERLEGALESTLTGGPVLDRQRAGVEGAFRTYIDDIYPQQLSREEAGQRVATGVESVVGDPRAVGSKKWVGSQLYQKLDDLINQVDEGRISIPQSQQLLEQYEAQMARDPEYARLLNTDPDMAKYIATLKQALRETDPEVVTVATGEPRIGATGLLTQPTVDQTVRAGHEPAFPLYNTLKQFRTNVGRKLESPFATSMDGGIEAEKRHLYGVLSQDMAAGADELGGVGAVHARTRADSYWRSLADRLKLIDPVFKNADNPTGVYEALRLSVRNNPTALAAAKKTMPADTWEEFADTYMQSLLRARPGAENFAGDAVSYHTIATNLNKLKAEAPESYKLLAGDKARALDNILILANRFKESERFFNRSRTANTLNATGLLGSGGTGAGIGMLMGHGPAGAITGATAAVTLNTVIPWLTAKVMTSPTIRKAAGKMPTALIGGDITPSVVARALIAAGASQTEVQELLDMGD